MKYLIALKNTALIFAVLLLNSVAFSTHTSAMPTMSHEMNSGMKHGSSDSASCATLCRTAVFNKDEFADSNYDEDDDEPVPPEALPYYAHFGSNFIPKKIGNNYVQNHPIFRPPDLVKLYSNYRF